MGQLPITNVVNISVSQAQLGLGEYNVNNIVLFTKDVPAPSFGTAGYAIYLSPGQASTDFGSGSTTAKMANEIFSQQPNMLAGGGYLAIIPMYMDTQTGTFSDDIVSGAMQLKYGTNSISITSSSTAGSVESDLQAAITPLTPGVVVSVTGTVGDILTFSFSGGVQVLPLSVGTNTTGKTLSITQGHEQLGPAITRTQGLVQYFGILPSYLVGSAEAQAAAAIVQPLNALLTIATATAADIEPATGFIDIMRLAGLTRTRGLYYGASAADALLESAGYMGRALSTNFDGSNTTQTMHLKQIAGVGPDLSLTQTLLNKAVAAGADTYPSLQGVPGVFCSGTNDFFDNQYNMLWLIGALQVAGFNYLAQSATKVPQTEQGMNGLKGAYRKVLQQAVNNGFLAPGTWTSSTTFGNQLDFLANIEGFGFYIYSAPVSQQSAASREAREAPLVQISVKLAGAIQSSDVIVYVNP